MGFWGVEVKPGEPLKIKPKLYKIVNISQAALGEVKDAKGAEHVPIRLKIGDEKYVIGTLSSEDTPHLMLDLVFEREFELSHDWKDGSIYFTGYVSKDPSIDYEVDRGVEDLSREDGVNPFNAFLAGKVQSKVQNAKPKKEQSESESDEDGDEDDDSEDESNDAGERDEQEEDSTDDSADKSSEKDMDDSSDSDLYSDSDDLTPQKAKLLKKRSSDSATQTPVLSKKAKLATPENKGNLSVNPSKKDVKASAADRKSKAKHGNK